MTENDLYKRPSREAIAARVGGAQAIDDKIAAHCAPPAQREPGAAVRNFATHLTARMRALGWDQAQLQAQAELSPQVAARAINGTGIGLDVAEKIAGLAGLPLVMMIGPYSCRTCSGEPPAGYACLECGTEGPRQ